MKTLDFLWRHIGQYVTAPGGAGNQCVDLVNLYLLEEWHLAHVWADACQWQHARIPGWSWVGNQPTNAPGPESIVIWCAYPPHQIGAAGHIALCVQADGMHLVTFDQNWPDGSPCRLVAHDYGGVVGWLRKT